MNIQVEYISKKIHTQMISTYKADVKYKIHLILQ